METEKLAKQLIGIRKLRTRVILLTVRLHKAKPRSRKLEKLMRTKLGIKKLKKRLASLDRRLELTWPRYFGYETHVGATAWLVPMESCGWKIPKRLTLSQMDGDSDQF